MNEIKWAAARLIFHAYIGLSLVTVVGGFLTAPIMTWYFFGDWRFWRHFVPSSKLFFHGWKIAGLILRGHNGGFLLSVPLTSPPYSAPLREIVHLAPSWQHGSSCGPCTNCCSEIGCPVLDTEKGICSGYNSFFWRYFNCGRYPSKQPEIDYYSCPKWLINTQPDGIEIDKAAYEGLPAGSGGEGLSTG